MGNFLHSYWMRTGCHSWKDIVFSFCIYVSAVFIGFGMDYKTFIVFLNYLSVSFRIALTNLLFFYSVECRSVKPLLSSSELSITERLVKDFGEGDGQKLQQILEKRARSMDSWV
jgi:hypothetical protein